MRLLDITVPLIPGMATYPGEPGPELSPVKRIAHGDNSNVSALSLGLHTGTHVDAPQHMLERGLGADSLPLDALCGPARVVRIHDPKRITRDELEQARLQGSSRVLFRTRNSELWQQQNVFHNGYVYLEPEAARWLVARGVRLVGTDYLSIEAFGANRPEAHLVLLHAGVIILEGLDLRAAEPGEYVLWCLPLKIVNADGAPARAVLLADR